MKPPLIVNNHGDVMVFASAQDLERELEAIDVEHHEYVAYDSEGRLVELGIGRRRGTLFFSIKSVVVQGAEPTPTHTGELREVLRRFLQGVGESNDWLANASLEALVSRGLEKYRC